MLDALTRKAPDDTDEITEAQLAAAEREELLDEAHLELFQWWYRFGGLERGLSPLELAAMPQAMLQDFGLLMSKLNQRLKRERRKTKPDGLSKRNPNQKAR